MENKERDWWMRAVESANADLAAEREANTQLAEENSGLLKEAKSLKRKLADVRQVAGAPFLDDHEARRRILEIVNEP